MTCKNERWSLFEKEGLQAAVDFTKTLLTLSGGAIAFVLQPMFYEKGPALKLIAIISLFALSACVLSGLFVISGSCVMLSRGDYHLEKLTVKIPGLINVFSFAVGFICVSLLVAAKILGWDLLFLCGNGLLC